MEYNQAYEKSHLGLDPGQFDPDCWGCYGAAIGFICVGSSKSPTD
jgi:hypothetical protein